MGRTVVELHVKTTTGSGPGLIRLPDIDVLLSRVVVSEAALARVYRFLDRVLILIDGFAVDLARVRVAVGVAHPEDVEALISAQVELDRNRASRLSHVQVGVVYRLEESSPVVDDLDRLRSGR